jgi:hypothetical protein
VHSIVTFPLYFLLAAEFVSRNCNIPWQKLQFIHALSHSHTIMQDSNLVRSVAFIVEVFYGTQYHPIPHVEKDSYVIEKGHICNDSTVEINFVPPVFLCGMSGIHWWYE